MSAIHPASYIFLSPHLDDAVLSCGGMMYLLAQAGQVVQAITIFAGDPPPGMLSPFARSLHERWQADPAGRRDEDVQALALVGAEGIHWPYLDAVYRRDPLTGIAWYDSEESIFGKVATADAALIDSIAQRLKMIDASARLIVPLTAGHHVDHQIVRAAAESLGRERVYYEDYPYAEKPDRLQAILGDGIWTSELVQLSEEAIRFKAKAISLYRSQISSFFQDEDEILRRIRAYAELVSGEGGLAERLWHCQDAPKPALRPKGVRRDGG